MACASDPPLMQSTGFVKALRTCGQDPLVLPSGLVVLRQRVAGVPMAMLPRALPPDDLGAQLRDAGLARTPILLSPEVQGPCKGVRLRNAMMGAQIDLRPPETIRRAALHQNFRNQLRRAEGAGLRIKRSSLRPDDPLPEEDAAQGRLKGYRNWPVGLTRAYATANPGLTHLFTATLRKQCVARMLFLQHGSTRATYHIGLTSTLGRLHHAHNLLLWHAQCWLAEHGVQRLDLGLLDRRTPDLNRFKLRSGAARYTMGGTWLWWRPLARRCIA